MASRRELIVRAIVVTMVAGVLLQLSNLVDFQDIVAALVVDSFVPVRLIDIAFRLVMGALLLVVASRILLIDGSTPLWATKSREYLRLAAGRSWQLTAGATALSVTGFLGLLIGSSTAAGAFVFNPAVLVDDNNWLILLAALVPGIWEELTFRGVMLSSLQSSFSANSAVAISSVLFGLMHLSNVVNWEDSVVVGVIAATTLGTGWGYMTVKTGSVIPAVVNHYLVDVILFDELFIDPSATDDTTGPIYATLVFVYPLLIVISTRFAAHRTSSATG